MYGHIGTYLARVYIPCGNIPYDKGEQYERKAGSSGHLRSPGTAFTIAVLYWLNWAVALASEFTAAGLLMQRWFPHSPAWVWSAAFIVVVFLLNILSVRLYGESEFWFASIKVFAIIAFIIIGLLAMFGAFLVRLGVPVE